MKQRQTALLGSILVIITGALYWPAVWFPFAIVDDELYVTQNAWVKKGLSLAGLKWGLTSTAAANWHPVTWWSHELDCSIWGTFAGGHHLTSVVLHALNTLLLFLLLKRLTGLLWPSFLVAALFGWHPLHVESVAWIAERKDVLSTMFFLLAVGAYIYYTESKLQGPKLQAQNPKDQFHISRSGLYYSLALLFFALGLMAKPMLVTLPFVLLLLDFWPLRRWHLGMCDPGVPTTTSPVPLQPKPDLSHTRSAATLLWLLVEKLPFLALAVASSIVTVMAQKAGGAVKSVEAVPPTLRLFNALSAYGHYLIGAIWPTNLCIFYPLPTKPPVIYGLISGVAILLITVWSIRSRRKQPWVLVGWFWFLGTLVPVIGLVQVGVQARADRYTYIPFVGLFILAIWTINSLLEHQRRSVLKTTALSVAMLCCCLGWARHQLEFWQDNVSLCRRAVAVTENNAFAHNNLGVALAEAGNLKEATKHYAEAVRLKPNYVQARYNLGIELASAGDLEGAKLQFTEALKQDPGSEVLHNNLGVVLAQQQKLDSAIEQFHRAIELNPEYPKSYLNCAMTLQKQGDAGAAVTNYYKALSLDPAWPEALDKLARLLAACPAPEYHNPAAAMTLAEQANQMTRHTVPEYLDTLAFASAAAGQFSNAVSTAILARDLATRKGRTFLSEKLARDVETYGAGHVPSIDWRGASSAEMTAEWERKGAASRP